MGKHENKSSGPRGAVDQALEASYSVVIGDVQAEASTPSAVACHDEIPLGYDVDSCLYTMMITNVYASLSYHALHLVFKPFGTVLRIHLIYGNGCLSNRCYVTYTSEVELPLKLLTRQ